jgi:hypothetical protein
MKQIKLLLMIINIKAYKINKIFNAINVRTSMMH